jgi:hypothetical protein
MRDDRMASFQYKQEANFLLYKRVLACSDAQEYEMLRQSWDTLNRPKYEPKTWSEKQEEVLELVEKGVSYDDEEQKRQSHRWLYIKGPPGSGKSMLLLELAIRCAKKHQLRVLIVCPTGTNVYSFKSQLPDFDGVDRIAVDTIQGVLNYKRPGKDSKVSWSPPSALRRIDVLLCDEGSQYEDADWHRFFTSVKEQPHLPFVCLVADFQQLQPVSSGGACQKFCERMQSVELETVYRTADKDHLLFQNRIREQQPDRPTLQEYFGDRHWENDTLQQCVAYGMELADKEKEVFTWLTSTNRGAAEVCEAALRNLGITRDEVDKGFLCDPTTKSTLRILARPGIIMRLSRNLDKGRGFVNGALAEVCDSLEGNAVFIARLLGSGNFVLIHPMEEDGAVFLPCCYGYATTIRRAQGASLKMGCIYFDQHKFAAGRGYGYVAVSRFRSRLGCYLYGKLRRTDFLPVGAETDDEVLERGYHSVSDDDEEGPGLAYAFQAGSEIFDAFEPSEVSGDIALDFA